VNDGLKLQKVAHKEERDAKVLSINNRNNFLSKQRNNKTLTNPGEKVGSNASYNPVAMNITEARHTRRRLLNERHLITRGMFFFVILLDAMDISLPLKLLMYITKL
jgi:hypothetical protein